MARSYPAPNAFPGSASQPNLGGAAYGGDDGAVTQTTTPGRNDIAGGSMEAPNPFPGYPGSQPGGGAAAGGAYGNGNGATNESTMGQYSPMVGEHTVLNAPNAFPGGAQIPAGVPDSTGTNGQVPRLRRDDSSGTMP